MKFILALGAVLMLSACANAPASLSNRDYAQSSFSGVNSNIAIPGQYTSPHSF